MGLYENVKDAAREKGYSINQLEKELGFARSYISKFKTITPSAEKIQAIADFLGVSSEYLMTGKERDGENVSYYHDNETAQMAQEIFENKELRLLFSAARDASPEDLKTTHDMLMALKRKERGYNDDTGA